MRSVVAEFLFGIYVDQEPECNLLLTDNRSIVISFLMGINLKLENLSKMGDKKLTSESKQYLYQTMKILDGLFSTLKLVDNVSSINDPHITEFIRFVELVVERITEF